MNTYKAYVNWMREGEKVNPTMELLNGVEDLYVRLYNKACSLLNPCYAGWNKSFEALHPDQNEEGWQESYYDFIKTQANKVLNAMMPEMESKHGNKVKVRMGFLPGEDSPELLGYVGEYLASIRIEKI